MTLGSGLRSCSLLATYLEQTATDRLHPSSPGPVLARLASNSSRFTGRMTVVRWLRWRPHLVAFHTHESACWNSEARVASGIARRRRDHCRRLRRLLRWRLSCGPLGPRRRTDSHAWDVHPHLRRDRNGDRSPRRRRLRLVVEPRLALADLMGSCRGILRHWFSSKAPRSPPMCCERAPDAGTLSCDRYRPEGTWIMVPSGRDGCLNAGDAANVGFGFPIYAVGHRPLLSQRGMAFAPSS